MTNWKQQVEVYDLELLKVGKDLAELERMVKEASEIRTIAWQLAKCRAENLLKTVRRKKEELVLMRAACLAHVEAPAKSALV